MEGIKNGLSTKGKIDCREGYDLIGLWNVRLAMLLKFLIKCYSLNLISVILTTV